MSAKMFVEDEVGYLKTIGLFGPPGAEAYLAQFWPEKTSLFFDNFDVLKGQEEFKSLVALLDGEKVEVVDLRSAYASTLQAPNLSAENLVERLVQKVPRLNCRVPDGELVRELLHQDALALGEEKAVALNIDLSLNPDMPVGNIYFARDQSNVIGNTCFLGKMKYKIRQSEVSIIEAALRSLGYSNFYRVSNGIFEGGDAFLFNGNLYIGSGMRTSFKAIMEIAQYVHTYINPRVKTYMVTAPVNGEWKHDMEIMHLDTFMMPKGYSELVGCMDILKKCRLYDVISGRSISLIQHLEEEGLEVEDISREMQAKLQANRLIVSPDNAIAPKVRGMAPNNGIPNGNGNYNSHSPGNNLHYIWLNELVKGVGGPHCMGLQIQKYH